MSALEVVGVGAVFWFIRLVTEPEVIKTTRLLLEIQIYLDPNDKTPFLIWVGIILFLVTGIRNGMAGLTLYAQERFVVRQNLGFSLRLIEAYTKKSYSWFVQQNSADLTKKVVNDTWEISEKILYPAVDMTAKSIASLAIICLLFFVDVLLTAVVLATLLILAILFYAFLQKRLHFVGASLMKADSTRFACIAEIFGGLKEIKVYGNERYFYKKFSQAANAHRKFMLEQRVLSHLPHLALETMAIGALLAVIIYSLVWSQNSAGIISIASLYAIAGYRMLPALKAIGVGANSIRLALPFLNSLEKDLVLETESTDLFQEEKISFDDQITFDDVYLQFKQQKIFAIHGVSLHIPKNSSVAFVGTTGAGKSSLIDLLLGIYSPNKGGIVIDQTPLKPTNINSWRNLIGYVPQQIYLLDDTVRNNIAFGTNALEINDDAIRHAAKLASIDDFISNKMSSGYDTIVGERGVRLSGGERQRIGIARALYRNPSILILDEATSALDVKTEAVISEAISNLREKMTLIIIAHRLSTVRNCDAIHILESGKIIDSGTHDALVDRNETFRKFSQS